MDAENIPKYILTETGCDFGRVFGEQKPAREWEPYMCNLAVEKAYRGQGIGKRLVRLCEYLAKNHWR